MMLWILFFIRFLYCPVPDPEPQLQPVARHGDRYLEQPIAPGKPHPVMGPVEQFDEGGSAR